MPRRVSIRAPAANCAPLRGRTVACAQPLLLKRHRKVSDNAIRFALVSDKDIIT
jgi:hypothetical protein